MTDKRLRMVERIERDPDRPGWAKLHLDCGHSREHEDFPAGTPPPCFRQTCEVNGCAGDLGFVDRCEGGHGRTSIKKSHRAEGRNFVD